MYEMGDIFTAENNQKTFQKLAGKIYTEKSVSV